MRESHEEWLLKELPALEEEGILSEYYASALREHYAQEARTQRSPLSVLFGVLGALLVGGGIILLLGHNWNALSRVMRTVLVFLPLVASQVYAVAVLKRRKGTGARETAAVMNVLMTAAAIALIGQTYHIPGNLASFLFVWMWLSLPVAYLLRSLVVSMIYLAGITAWAGVARADNSPIFFFWLFYLAILPFLVGLMRDPERRVVGALAAWALVLQALWLQLFLTGTWASTFWILSYTCLFAFLHGVGHQVLGTTHAGSRAFRTVGSLGIVAMGLCLTYDWFWRESFWRLHSIMAAALFPDLLVIGVLLTGSVWFFVRACRKRQWVWAVETALPILALVGWSLSLASYASVIAGMVMFNVYLAVLGLLVLIGGVKAQDIGQINKGMGVLTLLLLVRFFDSELPMVTRGVVFVLLGLGFWGVNMVLLRKQNSRGRI